jgi:hypothetical protein
LKPTIIVRYLNIYSRIVAAGTSFKEHHVGSLITTRLESLSM